MNRGFNYDKKTKNQIYKLVLNTINSVTILIEFASCSNDEYILSFYSDDLLKIQYQNQV